MVHILGLPEANFKLLKVSHSCAMFRDTFHYSPEINYKQWISFTEQTFSKIFPFENASLYKTQNHLFGKTGYYLEDQMSSSLTATPAYYTQGFELKMEIAGRFLEMLILIMCW